MIERSSVVSRRGAIFYPYIKRVMTAAIVNMYFFSPYYALLLPPCQSFLSIYLPIFIGAGRPLSVGLA